MINIFFPFSVALMFFHILSLIFAVSPRPRPPCALGPSCWRESRTSWTGRRCRTCWRSTSRKTATTAARSKPSCTTRWASRPWRCSAAPPQNLKRSRRSGCSRTELTARQTSALCFWWPSAELCSVICCFGNNRNGERCVTSWFRKLKVDLI